jgi:hypothetical protein
MTAFGVVSEIVTVWAEAYVPDETLKVGAESGVPTLYTYPFSR